MIELWFLMGFLACVFWSYLTPAGERMEDIKKNFVAYWFVFLVGPLNIVMAFALWLEYD